MRTWNNGADNSQHRTPAGLWLTGTVTVLGCLLPGELRFVQRLKRRRRRLAAPECPLPVYLAEELKSPCLYGLFQPCIYVTAEAAEDVELMPSILRHELCHYRQWDHVWSALRLLLCAIYWFCPLVWLAAAFSRRDAELSCDEAALRGMETKERMAYGAALVRVAAASGGRGRLASCMGETYRQLGNRVTLVAKPVTPRRMTLAMVTLGGGAGHWRDLYRGKDPKHGGIQPGYSRISGLSDPAL